MIRTKTTQKFFLVGRNLGAADSIRYILEHEGYTVAGIGKHAAEVLPRIEAKPPDILMVGSELDDATGLELMRKVGRQHPDTKRILFVREADTELAKEALEDGVNGLLSPDGLMTDLLEFVAAVYAGKDYIYSPPCGVDPAFRAANLAHARRKKGFRLGGQGPHH